MADDDYDLGDGWTRFARRLREQREEYAGLVLAGGLEPNEYAATCARVRQIDDTIALIHDIRSGGDRAKKPGRLVLPEENGPE
jgi:hypothetical protein